MVVALLRAVPPNDGRDPTELTAKAPAVSSRLHDRSSCVHTGGAGPTDAVEAPDERAYTTAGGQSGAQVRASEGAECAGI